MRTFLKQRQTPLQKEWALLRKKEQAFVKKQSGRAEPPLDGLLAGRVPETLQNTLDAAFEKAFALIFEKGTAVIEKACRKEALEKEYKVNLYASEVDGSRKSLQKFRKGAGKAGDRNLLLSGVSGVGMGVLGIGLPDIPLFTAMALKALYETALHYGFDYHEEAERCFLLLLIEAAASRGEAFTEADRRVEDFIRYPLLPAGYSREEQVKRASKALSAELLYMKFLQGVPIIGAVGGACDAVCMKRLTAYAGLKYQKRFLMGRRAGRGDTEVQDADRCHRDPGEL